MTTTLKTVATKLYSDGIIDLDELEEALSTYFFEGEGKIFAPWSEERPKHPGRNIYQLLENMGRNIYQLLENMGFDFVSNSVSLEGTDYVFTIMIADMDWATVRIDYWNHEILFSD